MTVTANYPSSLDDGTTLPATIVAGPVGVGTEMDDTVPPHSTLHNNISTVLRELEAQVGIPGSAVTTSLDYLTKVATDPGHAHSAYLQKALADAKGDILAATAADTIGRLAVGSNGQVLTAASGEATGLQWATPDPGQNDPTLFLVNGDDYALTRAGIASALSAAAAVEGTVRLCGDVTADGTSLALSSFVTLDLGGHELTAPGSGSTDLITLTGTLGSAINLGTNATMGAKTIALASGGGASFAAGDIVRIYEETSRYYCQIAEIRSISTDTLTLVDSVKHAFTTGNGTKIRKVTPVTGARVINGRLNANNNTDTTRAINAAYTTDCVISGCEFTDFPQAAVKFETGLHNEFRDLHFEDCGSGSESDLQLQRQTYYHCIYVHSHGAKGFGPQSASGAGGEWFSCVSHDANGRAIKLAYEGWTNMIGCLGDGARGGYTGISVTLFSHDCDVIGSSAQGNSSYGFMLDSTIRCRLIACKGQGNTTADATHDDIDGTPSGNKFIDCSFDGGYLDGASSSDLVVDYASNTPAYRYRDLRWRALGGATEAVDAHGSLSIADTHLDMADNTDYVINFAAETSPVGVDYSGTMTFEILMSAAAGNGNYIFDLFITETFNGAAGATALANLVTQVKANADAANKHILISFSLSTQPSVAGAKIGVRLKMNGANGSDTIGAQRTLWQARLKYVPTR